MDEYRAYYFTLHATGVPEIDAILEAIAAAGKSYHHTADWGGGVIGDAPSVVQPIQEAANRAAEAWRR